MNRKGKRLFSRKAVSAEPTSTPKELFRVADLQLFTDAFRIGSRLRFHPEYEPHLLIESVVMGYVIEHQRVFSPNELQFESHGAMSSLRLFSGDKALRYSRVGDFALILPADVDFTAQLDMDSRAQLGRRGPFVRGHGISLISLQMNQDNIRCETMVKRIEKLSGGIHAQRQVVLLEPSLGSIAPWEPRSKSRVSLSLPGVLQCGAEWGNIEVVLLDFSETSLRLKLAHGADTWPESLKKLSPVLVYRDPVTQLPVSLRCRYLDARQQQRIFEIVGIRRDGEMHPYTDLDALELKINLHSTLASR